MPFQGQKLFPLLFVFLLNFNTAYQSHCHASHTHIGNSKADPSVFLLLYLLLNADLLLLPVRHPPLYVRHCYAYTEARAVSYNARARQQMASQY